MKKVAIITGGGRGHGKTLTMLAMIRAEAEARGAPIRIFTNASEKEIPDIIGFTPPKMPVIDKK